LAAPGPSGRTVQQDTGVVGIRVEVKVPNQGVGHGPHILAGQPQNAYAGGNRSRAFGCFKERNGMQGGAFAGRLR
jgi:hypothetical protein